MLGVQDAVIWKIAFTVAGGAEAQLQRVGRAAQLRTFGLKPNYERKGVQPNYELLG